MPIVNIGTLMNVAKRENERTPFGRRLLEARTRAGLKQIPAAKAIGMGQSALAELEKHGQGSSHVTAMARVYGCDPHWLATGEGSPGFEPAQSIEGPTPSEWSHLQEFRQMSEEDRRHIEQETAALSEKWKRLRREVLASLGVHGEADNGRVHEALGNVPKTPLPSMLERIKDRPTRIEPRKSLDTRHKIKAGAKKDAGR